MIAPVGVPQQLGGPDSSDTISATRTCSEGGFLVLTVQSGNTVNPIDGWEQAFEQINADSAAYRTVVFYKANVPAGDLTVTATRVGVGTFHGTLYEFSGMFAATLLAAVGFGGYGTSEGASFPAVGPFDAAGNLAIASYYGAGQLGDTFSTDSPPWTVIESSNAWPEHLIAYLVTPDANAFSAQWHPTVNVENANVLVVFKPGPVYAGTVKIFDETSSTWVHKPTKVYDGTAWVEKPISFYDGTEWKLAQ
jgi:hypothetical protein